MNAELEERILYVLSALEDANEALDKCDRLMMSKRSEGRLKDEQDKQDESKQVAVMRKEEPEDKQEDGGERGKKGQRLERRSQSGRKSKQPVLLQHLIQKTKAVQTENSLGTASMQITQPSNKAQNIRALQVVHRGPKKHVITNDADFGKVLKKIQTNNDEQWKHVRKFIRTVLMNELEEERWSRKSTEDLNSRLAKQNQQLRSKLQEKREERQKLDERIKGMKSKYKEKSRALNQNQQIVVSRCEETFEKLSQLHNDLEVIQQQLVMDTERFEADAAVSPVKENTPTQDMHLKLPINHEGLSEDLNQTIQALTNMQEKSLREEILKEYYPMIVESRIVMESLLSSIGHRISRLIEMNTRASISQLQTWPPNRNYHQHEHKAEANNALDDSLINDDLLYLFSKEFEAAADFWKAKSYKTYKRLQQINCQNPASS